MGIPPGYNMIIPVYFDFSVQTCITSIMLYFIYRTLCTSINPISSKTIQLLSLSPVFNTKHYFFYCFYTFPKVPFLAGSFSNYKKVFHLMSTSLGQYTLATTVLFIAIYTSVCITLHAQSQSHNAVIYYNILGNTIFKPIFSKQCPVIYIPSQTHKSL